MILKNATVHTGEGRVLRGCDIRVERGKIAEVGPGIEDPGIEGAEVVDLTGAEVFPGFVDASSYMGTMDMAFPAKDYNENSHPVTPHLDIWHSIDPDEINRQELYKAGITSVAVTPGNQGVLGGACVIVKSYGQNLNRMTVKRDAALKGSVTGDVTRVFAKKNGPKTRMGMIDLLINEFERRDYGDGYRDRRARQIMDRVRSGETPLIMAAETAAEMESVLTALSGYRIRLAFALAYEAGQAADAIEKAHAGVILGDFTHDSAATLHHVNFDRFADMAKRGVRFSLSLMGPNMMYGRECLLWMASKLMRSGCDSELILEMLGANCARLYGADRRIGRISPGMDADLAVYDRNPIEHVGARLLLTVIDGETVYSA